LKNSIQKFKNQHNVAVIVAQESRELFPVIGQNKYFVLEATFCITAQSIFVVLSDFVKILLLSISANFCVWSVDRLAAPLNLILISS
jgi:predicted nucleic acid-binding Zn finger protein